MDSTDVSNPIWLESLQIIVLYDTALASQNTILFFFFALQRHTIMALAYLSMSIQLKSLIKRGQIGDGVSWTGIIGFDL
jgi:hypothetical protein